LFLAFGQVALAAPITGSGTGTKIAKFTGSYTIGNSVITEWGGSIGINRLPGCRLHVDGDAGFGSTYNVRFKDGNQIGFSRNHMNYISVPTGGGLVFRTGGSNQLFVASNGRVGIKTTGPSYELHLNAQYAAKSGGGAWANTSDVRLKTNIEPLTEALDAITQLEPVKFEWVNPQQHDADVHAGFIAQDVEQVFPEWVDDVDPWGGDVSLLPASEKIKSLGLPTDFDAYLVQAIKELHAENAELAQRVAEIKQRVCQHHPAADACTN